MLIINLPTPIYDLIETSSPNAEGDFPMAGEAKRYYLLIKSENLITVLEENWGSWPAKIDYQLETGRLFMIFGVFLLRFYAGRRKLFSNIGKNIPRFIR